MIEKMKFINLVGPVNDIERVKEKYVSKYEIQMEEATKEHEDVNHIKSFEDTNPYADLIQKIEFYADLINVDESIAVKISKKEAIEKLNVYIKKEEEGIFEQLQVEAERKKYEAFSEQIRPFMNLEFKIDDLQQLQHVYFRFGKMPRASYMQFTTYLMDQPEILFEAGMMDTNYAWGIYLVPKVLRERVDSIFTSFHFEELKISVELKGTPKEAYNSIQNKISSLNALINEKKENLTNYLLARKEEIASVLLAIREGDNLQRIQKYMVHTTRGFYCLVGWIPEKDSIKLKKDIENDANVILTISDSANDKNSEPPTKLKNNPFVKPFEFFVKIYGTPSYNEIDPTPFVAITYSILFGMMFGDVGQGAVLSLAGFLLYKFKGIQLGAIMSIIGLFSVFFGFMFGSIFGFEDILTPVLISPMHDMNTVLVAAVGFGVALILIAMVLNIINAIKQKDLGNAAFGNNGLAGFLFYGTVVVVAVLAVTGGNLPATGVIATILIILFLLMLLKEPLANLIKKEKKLIHGNVGAFFTETFFESFEVLLSYISNTVSFVRVGAFALSHAGMMSVVLMLADAQRGNPNLIVIIAGNLLVMAMEGLVVGIQVLRLEFYEMFSRFYKSSGREFNPFKSNRVTVRNNKK